MKSGVTQLHRPPEGGPSAAPASRTPRRALLALSVAVGLLGSLFVVPSAFAAAASVGLGTATSFSVLAGSTVTNTGPTTMFGDLGLSPGSSVTGAPHVLGATHVDDAVAIGAKSSLTTAYNDAASRPSNGSAGTDLSGQTFTPGVRTASSSLLLSAGSVTLDAQGNPNAVFIFQVGSTLTTGSNTSVSLINGAQACNVFWQIGSSATLGTGTRFVGTVMAAESITANTAATIHGRLLASVGAVTLDTNTITTSTCASSVSGEGGGSESLTPTETAALTEVPGAKAPGTKTGTTPPVGSRTTGPTAKQRAAKRRAAARRRATTRRRELARRHRFAHPIKPNAGGFTG
jgi:hypothetical protein